MAGNEVIVNAVGEEEDMMEMGAAPLAIPPVSDLHYTLINYLPYLPRSSYTFLPLLYLFRKLMRYYFVEPLDSKESPEY